jgi:hypothetical protein
MGGRPIIFCANPRTYLDNRFSPSNIRLFSNAETNSAATLRDAGFRCYVISTQSLFMPNRAYSETKRERLGHPWAS